MIERVVVFGGHVQALGLARQAFAKGKEVVLLIEDKYQIARYSRSVSRAIVCSLDKGERLAVSGERKQLRDRLHDYLQEHGVGTVIHYPIAPHKQECYAKEAWNIPQLSLPITEMIADCELSLPISPCMTKEQMEYVENCINDFK